MSFTFPKQRFGQAKPVSSSLVSEVVLHGYTMMRAVK